MHTIQRDQRMEVVAAACQNLAQEAAPSWHDTRVEETPMGCASLARHRQEAEAEVEQQQQQQMVVAVAVDLKIEVHWGLDTAGAAAVARILGLYCQVAEAMRPPVVYPRQFEPVVMPLCFLHPPGVLKCLEPKAATDEIKAVGEAVGHTSALPQVSQTQDLHRWNPANV